MDGIWGDNECNDKITAVDALAILRNVALLSPLAQQEPCPDIALEVAVAGYSQHTWGDLDCKAGVTAVDALAVLRSVAMLSPLAQSDPCPDVGEAVHVTIAVSP